MPRVAVDAPCLTVCGAGVHLGDTLAFHAEAADGPVAAADGALHALADHFHMKILGCIERARPIGLGERVVRLHSAVLVRTSASVEESSSSNIPS